MRVVMGDDGVLVLLNNAHTQLWTSASASAPAPSQYGGAPSQQYGGPAPAAPGASMDSSGQSAPAVLQQDQSLTAGAWRFIAQGDGNLVLYEGSAPRWASKTTKKKDLFGQIAGDQSPPYRLALQEDGNLALYEANNRMLWSSQSNGRGVSPFIAVLQGDGAVTLTDKTGWMTFKLTGQGTQLFDRPKLRNILCSAGTRGPQQLVAGESLISPSGKFEV